MSWPSLAATRAWRDCAIKPSPRRKFAHGANAEACLFNWLPCIVPCLAGQYLAVHTCLRYPEMPGNLARPKWRHTDPLKIVLTASCTRARHMDAKTPAEKKIGTITVGNKNWDFPIYDGSVGPQVMDISKLYGESGLFTYDPGFTSTASCESKITYIDGDEGILLYRGYPIEQLAEHGDFLETCY